MRLPRLLGTCFVFALSLALVVDQWSFAAPVAPLHAQVIILADLIANKTMHGNGKIPYRFARVVEHLLYKHQLIENEVHHADHYHFKFSRSSSIEYDSKSAAFSFLMGNRPSIEVKREAGELLWRTGLDESYQRIPAAQLSDEKLLELAKQLYSRVVASRGYDGALAEVPRTFDEAGSAPIDLKAQPHAFMVRVREKQMTGEANDHTDWKYFPVRLIAYPATKILYELPGLVTSLATESVSRSPLDNLLGAGDEAREAGKLARNGFSDFLRGLVHRDHATAFDGSFEMLDAGLKLGEGALDLVKSGISLIGYPLFRLAGGKKSVRVPLRGKRAVVVLVDTALFSDGVNAVVDTYGETIVRDQLKGISDYYCVTSSSQVNDLHACIDHVPADIQYIDIVSLQHTGGIDDVNQYAEYAAKTKGLKPELLLSIGCYDEPSHLTERENTLGQQGESWAVHYYLANMLAKRLRGIPIEEASQLAFKEGYLTNAIDPVSYIGYVSISADEGDWRSGYVGSTPNLVTVDTIIVSQLNALWRTVEEPLGDKQGVSDAIAKIRDLHVRIDLLLTQGKIHLTGDTAAKIEESKGKLNSLH